MKDGEIIDPGRKGLEKCGVNTVYIPPNYISQARDNMFLKMNINYRNINLNDYCRVLTYEEAVQGNTDEYIGPINRGTSPGYPFNSDPKYLNKGAGKSHWLGINEYYDFESEGALELRKLVDELEENCEKGLITGVICADTKKDERRPIAKVNEGKTRMFSACPMHYVVLFRKYFLGCSAWIMHQRNYNDIAVGMNVYSDEWDFVARKLQTKGKHVIAGDFSNFDGSLNVSVLWAVFDVVNSWYKRLDKSEKHERIRLGLWIHLVNSVHIYEDNIYQWTHSQPSGNPFTVILNSIYNCLIMRIAYLHLTSPMEYKYLNNLTTFDDNVAMICYGDDNCLNINNKILKVYNQVTISKAMHDLGHTYTDETKTGQQVLARELSDIMFLKRSFTKHQDETLYTCPLDINVVYDMINWVRKNEFSPEEMCKKNVENALMEMSLHGEEKFNQFVKELKDIDIFYDLRIQLDTYNYYRFKIETLDHFGLALN